MDGDLVILRDFIATLSLFPPDNNVIVRHTLSPPSEFMSWRGVYSELSLDPHGDTPKTVKELLTEAQACIGKTFTGYKGGDFTMHNLTDVYADGYGTCPGYKVVGAMLVTASNNVLLITERELP